MKKKTISKYHVDQSQKAKKKRTVVDQHTGKTIVFSSGAEKRYYDEIIRPGFQNGSIVDYDLQRRYILQDSFQHKGSKVRRIDYVADYWVMYADGHEQVRDTKGAGKYADPVAKIKRKLFWARYPDIDYEWICRDRDGNWVIWDDYLRDLKKKGKKNES